MPHLDDYSREVKCIFKQETYLVRDNGAILRLPKLSNKKRTKDNVWTFGESRNNNSLYYAKIPVHCIVCTAFNGPNPQDKPFVGHLDMDPQNNKADNLKWMTKEESQRFNKSWVEAIINEYGSMEAYEETMSIIETFKNWPEPLQPNENGLLPGEITWEELEAATIH